MSQAEKNELNEKTKLNWKKNQAKPEKTDPNQKNRAKPVFVLK
jgi:hypothetical protein